MYNAATTRLPRVGRRALRTPTMTLPPRCVALVLMLSLAAAGGTPQRAQAQPADYPNRPVSFIVPFAPGGVTSLFARILGQKLEQRFGKPFVVENRPGGGGVTAAAAVANATPDGYTIMMASSTVLAINVTMRKSLPYDPRTALTPIALLARVPFVLVVNPALPIQSVADLVKLAREKPGQIAFGTPGPGTFHHLNAEMFKSIFGLDLVHVPYKGSAPALNDLVGGHVDIFVSSLPQVLPLAQSGQAKALAVTSAKRTALLPDVPTLEESGISGFDLGSWWGIAGPARMPANVVNALNAEIGKILASPELGTFLTNEGAEAETMTPQQFGDMMRLETERWTKVAHEANISID